jgi:uncharacterized YccA/Bax inhibitor family protein
MHSSNPVFSRNDVFTRNGYATFRNGPAPVPQPAPAPAPAAEQGGVSYVHPGRGQQAPPPPSHPYAPQPGPAQPPTAPMRAMTMDDVISRTGILLLVALVTGALAWGMNLGWGAAIGAMLIGFVLSLVNTFKRVPSPGLIITYAAVEGVFLGALAHALESRYPGIAVQAAAGTAVAFGAMLLLYRSGRIRVTPRFTRILIGAAIAYLLLMVGNLIVHLVGTGFNAWGGTMGLLTAGIAITLACLFLTLDFDMIDQGIRAGWPEQEAWRASFGLMVTLVWLYFEMLRLIAVLRGE